MPANSANPGLGTLQSPLIVAGFDMRAAVCDCAKTVTYKKVDKIPVDDWIKCCILGRKRQTCVQEKLDDAQKDMGPHDERVHAPAGARYLSPKLPPGKKYCMPDFVVGTGTKPLSAEQITAIYELKTPCNREGEPLPSIESWHPDKAMGGTMRRCYERVHLKGEKPNPEKLKVEAIGPTKESCP